MLSYVNAAFLTAAIAASVPLIGGRRRRSTVCVRVDARRDCFRDRVKGPEPKTRVGLTSKHVGDPQSADTIRKLGN